MALPTLLTGKGEGLSKEGQVCGPRPPWCWARAVVGHLWVLGLGGGRVGREQLVHVPSEGVTRELVGERSPASAQLDLAYLEEGSAQY